MNTSTPEQHVHRALVAAVRAVQEVHHYGVDDVLVALTCVRRQLQSPLRPALGKDKVPAGRGYTKKQSDATDRAYYTKQEEETWKVVGTMQAGLLCGPLSPAAVLRNLSLNRTQTMTEHGPASRIHRGRPLEPPADCGSDRGVVVFVYVHPHPCMHRVHVPTEQIRPSTSEESTTVKSPLPARPGGGGPMMPNVVEGRPDA